MHPADAYNDCLAYEGTGQDMKIWVPRRSKTKPTYIPPFFSLKDTVDEIYIAGQAALTT